MKKVFISRENSKLEFVKNIIYSFQVLIVGVAIPVLFMIGISSGTTKKTEGVNTQVHEVSNLTQLSPKQVIEFSFPKI